MNKEEFKLSLKELEAKHKKERNDLMVKYALANNPYKEGDILQNHSTTIKVEKIKVTIGLYDDPSCIYIGPELKKDLTPKKNGISSSVYQGSIALKKLN